MFRVLDKFLEILSVIHAIQYEWEGEKRREEKSCKSLEEKYIRGKSWRKSRNDIYDRINRG